jgi:hypothetical protein
MALDATVTVPAAEEALGAGASVTMMLTVAEPNTAVGVPLTVQPAVAPTRPFHVTVKPAGAAPENAQVYEVAAALPPEMAGSVAPAFVLEYAAPTSPFPSVFARASAAKTWNMFVEAVMAVDLVESALPVSMAVRVTVAAAKVAVGVPETTQLAPVGVTIRPAGRGGAKMHAVSGRMPPVVGIV